MSKPLILVKVATALTLALFVSGCNPDPCVESVLQADAKYHVTFLEVYDENSSLAAWDPDIGESAVPECEFEMTPMTSFVATALYRESMHYPNSCTSWALELDEFSGAGEIIHAHPAGNSMFTSYQLLASWRADVDLSGCKADWRVDLLIPEGGDPFQSLDASEPPPLLMHREISVVEQDGCGDTRYECDDYWVGSIERVY